MANSKNSLKFKPQFSQRYGLLLSLSEARAFDVRTYVKKEYE